jgi:dCMP deaminase
VIERPSWSEYFLGIAQAVSVRGNCTRRQVGAVIVDPVTHDIIQPGYNGAPAGSPGCLEGACPRGRHYRSAFKDGPPADNGLMQTFGKMCGCGNDWPCPDAVPSGSSYDTGPGACTSIHAEANAIIRAGKLSRGCVMYITCEPCDGCFKLIQGAGITTAIWPGGIKHFTPPFQPDHDLIGYIEGGQQK